MANVQNAGEENPRNRNNGGDADKARRAPEEARSIAEEAGRQAREGGEAMRSLAESGRRQANEVAETWRNAMDPFTAMQMDMTRWFDDVWRRATGMSASSLRPQGLAGAFAPASMLGLPPCDLRETDKAYVLSVELPGMTKEDIELQTRDDLLTISGHKTESREESSGDQRISERRFGRFERSFPIPPDVTADQIEASFKDGVLKVTLPREREPQRPSNRIEIR